MRKSPPTRATGSYVASIGTQFVVIKGEHFFCHGLYFHLAGLMFFPNHAFLKFLFATSTIHTPILSWVSLLSLLSLFHLCLRNMHVIFCLTTKNLQVLHNLLSTFCVIISLYIIQLTCFTLLRLTRLPSESVSPTSSWYKFIYFSLVRYSAVCRILIINCWCNLSHWRGGQTQGREVHWHRLHLYSPLLSYCIGDIQS